MRATLAITLALVAVFGAVSVAAAGPLAPATSDGDAPSVDGPPAMDEPTVNDSNTSMGAEVSAFMQASAADANGSVDSGMFAAQWNQSNQTPSDLVNARASALENRLAALERQKERLLAKKDQMSETAFTAQLSKIAARIEAIERAINATSDRARTAGVNTTRLDALRNHAQNLTGPEIAALARNLSTGVGAGPPDHAGGPPDDRGPDDNSTPGNGPPGDNSTSGNGPPGDNSTSGNGPPGDNSTSGNGPPGDNSTSGNGPPGDNSTSGTGPPGDNSTSGNGPPGDNSTSGTGPPGDNSTSGNGPPGDNSMSGNGPPDGNVSDSDDATDGADGSGRTDGWISIAAGATPVSAPWQQAGATSNWTPT